MDIREWVHGSGIYKVSADLIEPYDWFIRSDDVDGEVQPLLHICDKDIDPTGHVYVCMTGTVRWSIMGYYWCIDCKQTFFSEDELACVWADGKGTGDEYEA